MFVGFSNFTSCCWFIRVLLLVYSHPAVGLFIILQPAYLNAAVSQLLQPAAQLKYRLMHFL